MKSSQLLLGLLLIIFFFTNCKKESDSSDGKAIQGTSKLKRVSLVSSVDSKEPLYIIDEYENNSLGQLSKETLPMYIDNVISGISGFKNYEYNSQGQLLKIGYYKVNGDTPVKFYNSENHIFTYTSDGKQEKENIEYPQNNTSQYKLFIYESGLKTRKFLCCGGGQI